MSFNSLYERIDRRLGPICDALDRVKEAQSLTNGEMLLLLTILLVGNLKEASADDERDLLVGILAALFQNDLAPLLAMCRPGLNV